MSMIMLQMLNHLNMKHNSRKNTRKSALIEHHNYAPGANFMITSTKLYVPVATLYFINK